MNLEGDKDLHSPRELTAEAETELALVEEKPQIAHVVHLDLKLRCTLAIFPSKHPLQEFYCKGKSLS